MMLINAINLKAVTLITALWLFDVIKIVRWPFTNVTAFRSQLRVFFPWVLKKIRWKCAVFTFNVLNYFAIYCVCNIIRLRCNSVDRGILLVSQKKIEQLKPILRSRVSTNWHECRWWNNWKPPIRRAKKNNCKPNAARNKKIKTKTNKHHTVATS